MGQSEGAGSQSIAVDRSDRPTGVSRALLVPAFFVTIALVIALLARDNAEPLILGLLVLFLGLFPLTLLSFLVLTPPRNG